jgi:hypothetical protein
MPSLFSILGLIEAYLDVLQISVGEMSRLHQDIITLRKMWKTPF